MRACALASPFINYISMPRGLQGWSTCTPWPTTAASRHGFPSGNFLVLRIDMLISLIYFTTTLLVLPARLEPPLDLFTTSRFFVWIHCLYIG